MVGITRTYEYIAFDDLREGEAFRTTYEVSVELVARYSTIAADRVVAGITDAAHQTDTAPPWVFCTFLPMFDAMDGRMAQGSVHARQSVRIDRAVAIGTRLDVEVVVERAFVRDGRERVVIATRYSDDGVLVCTATATYLWGVAAP